MKYLKKFNESQALFNDLSEDELEVIETCKDILLDLKDDGIEVYIDNENYTEDGKYYHQIYISISKNLLTMSDIIEVKSRLENYLNNIGYYAIGNDLYNNNEIHQGMRGDSDICLLVFTKISKI